MSRRIRNYSAYKNAVEDNAAKDEMLANMREMEYATSVARALMNMTGGDGRQNWEKGHEECVRHRMELEAKYGKPQLGFVSQSAFVRGVCARARRLMNKPAMSLCINSIDKNYKPFPTEEEWHKAAREVVDDTNFHAGA